MDFARTAKECYDRWRGFQPWPGAYTTLLGKKLMVGRMKVVAGSEGGTVERPTLHDEAAKDGAPELLMGVLEVVGDSMRVACGEGTVLELLEVQVEGKKRMSAAEFLRGYQMRSGERLGL